MTARLRGHFRAHEVEFFGRDRPTSSWPTRMYEYRDSLTADLVSHVFGSSGQFGFCSKGGSCAVADGRWRRASCRRDPKENVACSRTRPDMLIFLCETAFYDVLFERYGRAALFMRLENSVDQADKIAELLRENMPLVRQIKTYLANLPLNNCAPRMPFDNFQIKGGQPIARDAQNNLKDFCNTMDTYHGVLHNPEFRNKRKPLMRGAYMFDSNIGFQRDRLHSTAYLGSESRADGYHLLNAYHMYGYAISPGLHFDVSKHGGGEVRYSFQDALTRKRTGPKATHLNVTPDDRVIKAEEEGGKSAFSEGG